jgi:hypothetical protein
MYCFRKGSVGMFAKLAMLLHSKLALALIGAVLVAGGAVVATASGATAHLPQALFAQNGAQRAEATHTPGDDEATKTPGANEENKDLEGKIASIDAAGSSFVLTVTEEDKASSTVTVTVNADTKFEGVKGFADLKVGMSVEVKGAAQSDGSVLANKVEVGNDNDEDDNENDHEAQEAEVSGVIATVGVSSFTVKSEKGVMTTVTVSNATTFEGVKGFADLKAGMNVEVKGTKQSDGSIAAQRVQVEESEHSGGDSRGSGGSSGSSGSGHGGGD